MRHCVDNYKAWQPKFAAYDKWPKLTSSDYSPKEQDARKHQAILEMVSEAGEVLSLSQKANRKNKLLDREKVLDELGDTLWGLVGVMNEFNISWYELTEFNMKKLEDRNR